MSIIETVEKVRNFNRYYLPTMNLLGNRYLGSEYSATEARVLFEIYESAGCTASRICRVMKIDKSYLSRIILEYEKKGYINRVNSSTDRRSYNLYLTDAGKTLTKDFIEKSNKDVQAIIASLSDLEQKELVNALDAVINLLSKGDEK